MGHRIPSKKAHQGKEGLEGRMEMGAAPIPPQAKVGNVRQFKSPVMANH